MARAFIVVGLGLAISGTYIAWEVGGALAHYLQMKTAIAELRACITDDECEQAWAKLDALEPDGRRGK